ncbi:MAG: hypothetical protein Q7Q71_12390 [Verrucomicrobiota bacterium JB023]|nr:hypothetical protein [Verrucomicrobiota bacterium JB023]
MGFNSSLEKRFHWLGFPNLIRGLTIIQFVVTIALMLRPGIAQFLIFDWDEVLGGQVWRLASHFFLLFAPAAEAEPRFDPFGLLFAFIALMIGFLFNDGLENAWGVFRTSLFIYGCALGQTLANVVLAMADLPYQKIGGPYLDMAVFFAFATLFPKFSFRLMFLLPVPAWLMAAVTGAMLVVQCLFAPFFALFAIAAFFPYLVWGIPRLYQFNQERASVQRRRMDFAAKAKSTQGASFHKCEVCGATEVSHPDRDFRITSDDKEICSHCLDKG